MATWQDRLRCDEAPSWAPLLAHAQRAFTGKDAFDLRAGFATDAHRAARFSFEAPHVRADLSKNLIDAEAQRLLTQLAHECGLESHRDALLAGEPINASEQRAVTHVAWRNWAPAPAESAPAALHSIADWRAQMLALADAVRADDAITDVVNIGIGGSDLGPRMVVQALSAAQATSGPRVHFVANMDGHELAALLRQLRPEQTLFLVASKSFGTAETMRNALSARAWYQAQGGTDVARHFVALSANPTAARAFGIERCLGFDEGVGGRYSLWSSIGLSIAIAVGREGFEALLAGAHAVDRHFAETPLARNLPVQLALLDLWYRNALHLASRCVVPYLHGLRALPAYLQQLEMESNGKRVDAHGRTVPFATAATVWGQAGSNGQHAFFQALHQGSDVVPVEFVLSATAAHSLPEHHRKLLANALAQARALMMGQPGDAPERHFPGNRPSTVLLLPDQSAQSIGALLALYEHRTFALGSLWGINSFDQWGVELGKRHAGEIESALLSPGADACAALDASTAALVGWLKEG
ncbi:glucose-6-phosphate isomerase [Ottowia oryzae]